MALTRPKAVGLLAYLALEGRTGRGRLQDLFWSVNGGSALRSLLHQIKQIAPSAVRVEAGFVSTDLPCDAVQSLRAFERGDLEAGLEAYAGDFLPDLAPDPDSDLVYWLESTRAYLGRQALEAAFTLAGRALERGDARACRGLLERARALESGADAGLLGWAASQRAELEARLGSAEHHRTAHNLPAARGFVIGREPEISTIEASLTDSARLLTLVGLGGIGKTVLALEVAQRALHRSSLVNGPGPSLEGVYFVALEAAQTERDLLVRLAEALGARLSDTEDPWGELWNWVGARHLLVVLDNLEQLAGRVGMLAGAAGCPNLRLLCTSREVLGVDSEHVLPLEGLACERMSDPGPQLLRHHAGGLASGPSVDGANDSGDEPTLEICRALRGVPLAIRLTAPLLRRASARAVLELLRQSLDRLPESPELPARQRSIRAAFVHSWSLLAPELREALLAMTVFRGGATRQELIEVAGIRLSQLSGLLDASLLGRQGQRYALHPLILEYASELFARDSARPALRERHARYYLEYAVTEVARVRGAEALAAFARLREAFDNLREAWAWLLEHDPRQVQRLEDLVVYFDQQAQLQNGVSFFENAVRALHGRGLPEVESSMLIGAAWLRFRLGGLETAASRGRAALELLSDLNQSLPGVRTLVSKAANTLAIVASMREDTEQAVQYGEQALEFAIPGSQRRVTMLLNLANYYFDAEDLERVSALLTAAQQQHDAAPNLPLEIEIALRHCNFAARNPSFPLPRAHFEAIHELYGRTRADFPLPALHFELFLARLSLRFGLPERCVDLLGRFFAHERDLLRPALLVTAYTTLGLYYRDDPITARAWLIEAVRLAQRDAQRVLLTEALLELIPLLQMRPAVLIAALLIDPRTRQFQRQRLQTYIKRPTKPKQSLHQLMEAFIASLEPLRPTTIRAAVHNVFRPDDQLQ